MTKVEKKFYNEVIKTIRNNIKESGKNCFSILIADPNENKCGFSLIFAKNIITGNEILLLITCDISNSFRKWIEKNYELFIEMFKESGITPYLFFDEKVLQIEATRELKLTMEGKDLDLTFTI